MSGNNADQDGAGTEMKGLLKEKRPLETVPENSTPGDPFAEDHEPPDGGWGWVVCLVSFWTNGIIFGILNTFGILYVRILDEFDNGEKDLAFKASWIGALQITMTFFLSPVASIMVDRVGIRPTGFIGAVCATLGMLLSAFTRKMSMLYMTYGLLMGIGSSLIYNPSLIILGHYFKRRLGVVNGIVAFGSSVFTIVISFLEPVLLEKLGLYNTMFVLAAFLFILIPGSLTWKPRFEQRHTELNHYLSTESMYKRCFGCGQWVKRYLNVRIWRNKGYRVWVVALPVAFLGYFVPFVHLVKHTSMILPSANGGILVMCLSVTSGVFRLVFGKVADLPRVNRIRTQQIAFLVLGIATACIPFAKTFWLLIIISLIMGISDAAFICLIGPIAFDLLGPSGAAQGLGFLLGISSIPMTAGPPLAGLIFDYTGSYNLAFWAGGIPPIVGALILFLVPQTKVPSTQPSQNVSAAFAAMSRENLDVIQDYAITAANGNIGIDKLANRDPGVGMSTEQLHQARDTRMTMSVPHLTENGSPASSCNRTTSLKHLPQVMI